jgi:phage-related minor tail protein
VPYKPGPQAHYLVEKMAASEKTVVDALSTLTEKLASLEKKVDSYGGDLGKVQEKVDLAMQSISLVQQEQVQVAKTLRSQAGATATPHTFHLR